MDKLIQLIEEQKQLIVDFQKKQDGLLGGKLDKEFETKIDARLQEISRELVELKKPRLETDPAKVRSAENKAFFGALQKKLRGAELTPEETKTMTVGDPTTGGYLAPLEFVNEIIKIDVLYSPVRSLARVRTTARPGIEVPKKTSSASASWVSEIGTRSETTNPKFGLETVPTHEMYAMAKVSKQDLEDSVFDLEGFLREEFGEQFGVLEGTAFISGNAVGRPEGILTNASVGGFTGVTTSAKVVADDLFDVLYALNERYAANATWLWKRSTTLAISKLKDAGSINYVWQPGLQSGAPATVLGRPYVECVDMPAEAASAKAVAIGDFRAGYLIVDRLVIEILIDPYTSKSTGCIEISARKRVGGQVVLAEAIKIYTLKA
jgi:HK97 family phage major capsid protein